MKVSDLSRVSTIDSSIESLHIELAKLYQERHELINSSVARSAKPAKTTKVSKHRTAAKPKRNESNLLKIDDSVLRSINLQLS